MKDLKRHAEPAVHEALKDTRVVVVNGARQVGKTTLVRAITRNRTKVVARSFDRSADLQAAKRDPEAFVLHEGLMVIDEIQRAPEVVLPIKARVDEERRPGQFLLTGSARLLGLRALPDALVGRSETIELWPFSQGELDGCADGFVDAVFEEGEQFGRVGQSVRDELLERAVRGGFPEATKRTEPRRQRFFASYVNDLIDRDVAQLGDLQRRGDLDRLVRLLAARMATGLKVDNLASQSGIPTTTLERYLTLLEEVFLIKRVSPWSNSATSRAVRMRKLLFVDSGLAAHLSGRSLRRLARDPALAGPLLENFVLGELGRQLGWANQPVTLHHYRTRDGEEVDAVLEATDGRIVGVEVKASSTIKAEDFRHLVHLQSRAPEQFHRGVVLYTGERAMPFGPRLLALPMDALWQAPRVSPR